MAVQMMATKRARFFHEPVDWIIGVLPASPQVLLTVGFSETPDSS